MSDIVTIKGVPISLESGDRVITVKLSELEYCITAIRKLVPHKASFMLEQMAARNPPPQPREVGIPEGWQLVPIAATPEMESAAVERVRPYHDIEKWRQVMPGDLFRLAWPAMLAVAPVSPVDDGEGGD